MVAVHNDYRKGKKLFTFWLMTGPNGRFLKGEGATDTIALDKIVEQLRALNDAEHVSSDKGITK